MGLFLNKKIFSRNFLTLAERVSTARPKAPPQLTGGMACALARAEGVIKIKKVYKPDSLLR